ncbi:MAG: hypothetical protein ABJB12_08040 [Pseudomonadota bacterium]
MASVTQLSRYRAITRRDLPLEIPAGDSDLRPIALVLWLASVLRVGLALANAQVFGAEVTLALACVVLLPFAALRARHNADTVRQ